MTKLSVKISFASIFFTFQFQNYFFFQNYGEEETLDFFKLKPKISKETKTLLIFFHEKLF